MKYLLYTTFVFLLSLSGYAQNSKREREGNIPHLEQKGKATQLIVKGKPFLILGGELGNSSASSINYMKPVWSKLVEMNLNTVVTPVYWELIEPEEGKFDFSLLDSLLINARKNSLKLVLLWFGTWKNSMSCYVPQWVKKDYKNFPRSRDKNGNGLEILTPFDKRNLEADKRAFKTLLAHLKEVDLEEQTVLMVQVENEIAMIPTARDHHQLADEAFKGAVPEELMHYIIENKKTLQNNIREAWDRNGNKNSGAWEEVFGKGLSTEEIFMAWYYGQYANEVAKAGKAAYSLPMYVNAALNRPNLQPGEYPSGCFRI